MRAQVRPLVYLVNTPSRGHPGSSKPPHLALNTIVRLCDSNSVSFLIKSNGHQLSSPIPGERTFYINVEKALVFIEISLASYFNGFIMLHAIFVQES